MKVELLTSRTGGQNRGDVIEVSAKEAERMIEKGQAVLVRSQSPETTSKKKKAEKASK